MEYLAGCKHNTIVIYTRKFRHLWRKRFYVVCVKCNREYGPYEVPKAIRVRELFNAATG